MRHDSIDFCAQVRAERSVPADHSLVAVCPEGSSPAQVLESDRMGETIAMYRVHAYAVARSQAGGAWWTTERAAGPALDEEEAEVFDLVWSAWAITLGDRVAPAAGVIDLGDLSSLVRLLGEERGGAGEGQIDARVWANLELAVRQTGYALMIERHEDGETWAVARAPAPRF